MQGYAASEFNLSRDAFFTRIVHQYSALMYRVAYSVLRNPEDAEDAVAEALLKLLRTDAWRTITNEKPFLGRAVWRTALDRFAARMPVTGEESTLLALEDLRPSPEEQAAETDEYRLLHTLIDRLQPELREPLLLSAIHELNSREIGEALDLPEGTVRTRLMRARTLLREQYEHLQGRTPGREFAVNGDPR